MATVYGSPLPVTWTIPAAGLAFNTGVADANGAVYWVLSDKGWRGGTEPRPIREAKASAHGSFRSPNYRNGRVITWQGAVAAPTWLAREQAELAMAAAMSDPQLLYELRCQELSGEKFIKVELDGAFMCAPEPGGYDLVFTAQFYAVDPVKYSTSLQSVVATLPSSGAGLDWVTGGGLDWATGGGLNWGSTTSTGSATFNNGGTAPSWPVITFAVASGTLQTPTAVSSITGQTIRYNGTLGAGDTLRIDTSPFSRSVILNGSADVRTNMDLADWFSIPPGVSSVVFSSPVYNANATMTVQLYSGYW